MFSSTNFQPTGLKPTDLKPTSPFSAPHRVPDALLDTLMKGQRAADFSEALQSRYPLNFQPLAAFEPVEQQFSHQGVTFDGAIALAPSNPKFIEQPGQKVVMPIGQHRLHLQLANIVTHIQIAGRCTQPMVLEVLGADGAVITVQNGVTCPLPDPLQHDISRLPSQVFKLALPTDGSSLRLSAKAPFVLSSVAV